MSGKSVFKSCHCRMCRVYWKHDHDSKRRNKIPVHRKFRRVSKRNMQNGDYDIPIISGDRY